jgi:hypothetical protein
MLSAMPPMDNFDELLGPPATPAQRRRQQASQARFDHAVGLVEQAAKAADTDDQPALDQLVARMDRIGARSRRHRAATHNPAAEANHLTKLGEHNADDSKVASRADGCGPSRAPGRSSRPRRHPHHRPVRRRTALGRPGSAPAQSGPATRPSETSTWCWRTGSASAPKRPATAPDKKDEDAQRQPHIDPTTTRAHNLTQVLARASAAVNDRLILMVWSGRLRTVPGRDGSAAAWLGWPATMRSPATLKAMTPIGPRDPATTRPAPPLTVVGRASRVNPEPRLEGGQPTREPVLAPWPSAVEVRARPPGDGVMIGPSVAAVLAAAQGGDELAFAVLWRGLQPVVLR